MDTKEYDDNFIHLIALSGAVSLLFGCATLILGDGYIGFSATAIPLILTIMWLLIRNKEELVYYTDLKTGINEAKIEKKKKGQI